MKWNAIGHVPETIFPHAYERNVPELAREILKEGDPGNFGGEYTSTVRGMVVVFRLTDTIRVPFT